MARPQTYKSTSSTPAFRLDPSVLSHLAISLMGGARARLHYVDRPALLLVTDWEAPAVTDLLDALLAAGHDKHLSASAVGWSQLTEALEAARQRRAAAVEAAS